ncbi:HPr kinase/phosphorylase [Palleronia sp. KMU-117]|uniref:HPr kinase/phosphorylase n=1 Tax=Palleronia sp. KMU-117 TaxID=3434108 RepID=UPI003D73E39D
MSDQAHSPLDSPGTIHGSAVALGPRGLLILGPSGSGKSGLALSLMACGAVLVADDRVALSLRDGVPWLCAPPGISGMIEARHLGLLSADAAEGAWLALVVDLSTTETDRLPPRREVAVLGHAIPLVHKVESAHFAPAILQYLKAGRCA